MRRFLVLAARHHAGSHPRGATKPHWYRIGPVEGQPPEAASATLVWRPNLGTQIFTSFRGRLDIAPVDGGTIIVLEGEAEGGEAGANALVLDELLSLIGTAVSAPASAAVGHSLSE